MSSSLLPEILDLVVGHLHGDQETLKVCCVVSKSWIPRTRRHLFFQIRFYGRESSVESWAKAFPDPSNSPAHHTRDLSIGSLRDIIVATTIAHTWICTFCNIVSLTVEASVWDCNRVSLVPLHALFPSLESLRLIHNSIPSSDVFSFICSFPSLEALSLISIGDGDEEADISTLPSTSPKFTGALCLVMGGGMRSDIRRLVALPGGLHFTGIFVGCLAEDLESITTLVSACRDTLESFTILQYLPSTSSTSAPLNLSKATNLKEVTFQVGRSSVLWIVMTLQTVKPNNLHQITIQTKDVGSYRMPNVEEEFLPEWQVLDRLLVQFWTSHSIRPKLVDSPERLKGLTPTLFPELTRRGLLDIA